MTTEAATFQGHIWRQEGAWHKAFTRPNSLRQFRYFVEESGWDDVILAQEEWINRMCVGVMIVATLYFTPPILLLLLG